jgi:hypothetical protein
VSNLGQALLIPALGFHGVSSESFTGTDGTLITALSPPWVKHPGSTNTTAPTIGAGRIYGENTANTSIYYPQTCPSFVDGAVECDVVQRSDNDLSTAGIMIRASTQFTTMYFVRYTTLGSFWQLFGAVSGSNTQIGANVAQTLTVDQAYRLRLEVRGSLVTVSVAGAVIISQTDTTVPAAGRAGIRLSGNATSTTGVHLDLFRVQS